MKTKYFGRLIGLVSVALLLAGGMLAQETTGGLVGSVKDPTGAVVSGAKVTLTAPTLTGSKSFTTDSAGNYRFSNLPPDTYTVTVMAKGFSTVKREGVAIEVGHLPTLDIPLQVGSDSTVVEVSSQAPLIDTTTNTTQSNITEDVIQNVPHGKSFQSVIQFAPSARNEPLEGSTTTNGTGGNAPGSTTNGSDHGFSVAGGSDAENSYLVEGQETANLIGGYSNTNVPFDFIQEVQIKNSGVEAEHGGALGGVVNVVMKKGSNAYHGSAFIQFGNDALNGSQTAYTRYDPLGNFLAPGDPGAPSNGYLDTPSQGYQPRRDHRSDVFPGFTFGGPIIKNRVFGFIGFNPEFTNIERKVYYGTTLGNLPFSRNTQTYYTTARVDASITQKIRAYGSWLYQYQRQSGTGLPHADSTLNLFNIDTGCFGPNGPACAGAGTAPSVFSHGIGYKAPNVTANFGADITITPHIVATTRLGYYFENYNDFGYPTNGTLNIFQNNGVGQTDLNGNPLPASLQQSQGFQNDPASGTYTRRNSNKALQYDADVAWFKSGWLGSHNFKFGYQLNRLKNDIFQSFNEPYVQVFPGASGAYSPLSPVGNTNCAPFVATYGACTGLYGTVNAYDFGTTGKVTSFNHGLFAQDSWTLGRGVTINAGVRFDKEYLPASSQSGLTTHPIDFSWSDKISPRVGVAWDVFKDGRVKLFGSYGKFYDIMKLNVAISSFGGQFWNICTYTLDTSNLASITPALNSNGRYCAGDVSTGANWKGGTTPAGLTFVENINNRLFPTTCSTCSLTSTGVVPGLKPFNQHESVFGVDYQLRKNVALEVRWDRRRLDDAIEDSSIVASTGPAAGSETFVIGNPGKGVERTFNSFSTFLYGTPPAACTGAACPPQNLPAAARSYDGVEFRLTKAQSNHWFGMFSYTYSKLRGNYTGLTSSDISDGQAGGRSSPNNSRAFDEPYFSYNSFGGSSSGLLPTDRPSTFKGYAYYELGWLKKLTTDFGLFQYAYQGSPRTSYLDVGAGNGAWAVQAWNRGEYVPVSQNLSTGTLTVGSPRINRTAWYTQTDFNLQQNFKIDESKSLSFTATLTNLLNQRAITAYYEDITSLAVTNQYITIPATTSPSPCTVQPSFFGSCYIGDGLPFYAAVERPYDVQGRLNDFKSRGVSAALNSQYDRPAYYQLSRDIRLQLRFIF